MKEVILHYFVPENDKELEGLVEKPVGVKINSANPAEPMIFFENTSDEYEFVQQAVDGRDGEDILLRIIWGWRNLKDHVEMQRDGIRLCQHCRHIKKYSPNDGERYESRLKLLKSNGQWREPDK